MSDSVDVVTEAAETVVTSEDSDASVIVVTDTQTIVVDAGAPGIVQVTDSAIASLMVSIQPDVIVEVQSLGTQGIPGPPGIKGDKGDPGNASLVPGPKGDKGDLGAGMQDLGWIFIQDSTYTDASPFAIPANTKMALPNDAAGANTTRQFGPAGSLSWYDVTKKRFYPTKLGDHYVIRVNLTIVPTVNNKNITVYLDIGTPNSPFEQTTFLARGAGIAIKESFVIPIGCGSGYFPNGAQVMVQSETDVLLSKISMQIAKTSELTP